MTYMVHVTQDGEYVTGIDMNKSGTFANDNMEKIRNTYAGCHGWVKTGTLGNWVDVPMAGFGYSRWGNTAEKDVPDCVRMAEMLR